MGGMGGGGAAGKKYNLNASVNARNVFNVVNLAAPNGTLTSPFFGQSTSLAGGGGGPFGGGGNAAGNRRIEFQLRLEIGGSQSGACVAIEMLAQFLDIGAGQREADRVRVSAVAGK